MTEEQLRDVLARVVPEPPDSVADAAPVVRVARRRRRVRVAGVSALAAVLVAGTVMGVRTLAPDTDHKSEVVEQPRIPDPYATAPCPDPQQPWDISPLTDLTQVTAVRFCARDVKGADGADGPRDALVTDVGSFTGALRALAPADPARCAAVDPMPTDNRLMFQLSDGTVVGVPAGYCQVAEIEGQKFDGDDLLPAFLGALAAQRGDHDYAQPDPEPASCLFGSGDISPAQPGHDHLVGAVVCGSDYPDGPVELDGSQLKALQKAWDSAARGLSEGCGTDDSTVLVFARTDRGDNVQLDAGSCGELNFTSWAGESYLLRVELDQLLG